MSETTTDIQILYEVLQAQHDALCQRLHESECNKKVLTSMLNEYKEVISHSENNTDDGKTLELEEYEIQKLKLQSQTRKEQQFYENEISIKDNEIEMLRSQLEAELKRVQEPVVLNGDDNKVETEIISLQYEYDSLIETLDDLNIQCTTKENEHAALLDKTKELDNELNHYKEVFNGKKTKVEETTLLLNNLQDEYFDLKTTVDAATNKPLDAESRGNSLFAEVDDRRIQLQDNIQKMKLQYVEMKRQRSADLKEMATLRKDNIKLTTEIREKLDEHFVEGERKIILLQEEATKLIKLIEDYKIEIEKLLLRDETSMGSRLDIFKSLVQRKAEELRDVREQLQLKAKDNVNLNFKMLDNKKVLQLRDTKIMKMGSDIAELKTEINEYKMKIDESTLYNKEVHNKNENMKFAKPNKLKSIIKASKVENTVSAGKCVQFPEESLRDVSERSTKRRGGVKVPSTKIMDFS